MTSLLIFFVLPLATIIFAIVLEKIICNPVLVSLLVFAIYLIIAFLVSSTGTLAILIILAIIYAIIAFITAWITRLIKRIKCCLNTLNNRNNSNCCNHRNCYNENNSLTLTSGNTQISNGYPIEYINSILGNNSRNCIR